MTIRLTLLIALALFTPPPVESQAPCCSCFDDGGTACTACFYGEENGSCEGYQGPSIRYCGCAAEASGVGCSRLVSRTSVIGGDWRPEIEAHQLGGGGLLNPGKRRDGTYNFEEWALVSSEGAILRASRLEFAEKVHAAAERYRPREKGGTSASLVIEDAVHPQNSRAIPLPKVAPIDIDAELPASLEGQEIWFRAEVGKDGVVDQVLLLNVPDDLKAGKYRSELTILNEQLRDLVKLRYADQGRHRAVVFGHLRANVEGHLVMVRSRVLLPKCCSTGAVASEGFSPPGGSAPLPGGLPQRPPSPAPSDRR